MEICSCQLCSTGNYDPSEFLVDLSELRKERPVGVSGLMRVRNEARWVERSIDTCIDALDELIICYQESFDDTAVIIEWKRQQYPDKIKVFFYAPPIYSHNLSKEDFWYVYHLPKDSIHLLSNYYNYTLSKATFRYALKIDADQIYFTDRLSKLCDAYRGKGDFKCSFTDYLSFYFSRGFFSAVNRFYPGALFNLFDKLPSSGKIHEKYSKYLLMQVYQTKKPVSLSGINLYIKGKEWGLPAFSDINNSSLLFNGTGDLIIFRVSDKSYYSPFYQSPEKMDESTNIVWNPVYKTYRIIERFYYNNRNILHGGFFWYHMKFVGLCEFEKKKIYMGITFDKFLISTFKDLYQCKLIKRDRYHFIPHLFFFKYDKNRPSPDKIIGEL